MGICGERAKLCQFPAELCQLCAGVGNAKKIKTIFQDLQKKERAALIYIVNEVHPKYGQTLCTLTISQHHSGVIQVQTDSVR